MNNLKNVFDSIVGFEGSAATEGWREMDRAALIESIEGQATNFYSFVSDAEADVIADAVLAYRECNNSSDAWHVRDGLEVEA